MEKEKILAPEEKTEGVVKYTANLEGIIFTGIIDSPWQEEKRDILRMDGFEFGIFGNKMLCDRERFSEMAQKIAGVKRELNQGNRQPLFKFVTDNFYTKKGDGDE